MEFTQTHLYENGFDGYEHCRIPALEVTVRGTVLAFCEGRVGKGDASEIHLLLRRSLDAGESWEAPSVIWSDPPQTVGNPAPVVDRQTGIIWLLFCKNDYHKGLFDGVGQGTAPRTIWVTSSADDGKTWANPIEITESVKAPSWTWYATGPCHGIQLHNGRLVVPCAHIDGVYKDPERDPWHSHVIYSDDHGHTWEIGGKAAQGTNESTVVETGEGEILLNCRGQSGRGPEARSLKRALCWSRDGGESFSETVWSDVLVEPKCQASMTRFAATSDDTQGLILFSNPAGTERENMTIRISRDHGRNWNEGKLIHSGKCAYSDLCVLPDKTVACFYENGDDSPYERLTFARFDLEWLLQ